MTRRRRNRLKAEKKPFGDYTHMFRRPARKKRPVEHGLKNQPSMEQGPGDPRLHAWGVARLRSYEAARGFADIERDESVISKRLKFRIDSWTSPTERRASRAAEAREPWISPKPGVMKCGLCGTDLHSQEEAVAHQDKAHPALSHQ